jgi:hypothetical protein
MQKEISGLGAVSELQSHGQHGLYTRRCLFCCEKKYSTYNIYGAFLRNEKTKKKKKHSENDF